MISDDASDPAAPNSALLPSQQQTLNEAKRLMENGKPGQAAPLFAKLAEILTSAGQARRAATLHAQAAQAFARSRNEAALPQVRTALNLFLQYKMDQRASFLYADLSREFTKRGMKDAAASLAKEFGSKITPPPAPVADRLPTSCPHCGAPLRSDEAHWIDVRTVECVYCGTPIHPLA